MAEIVTPAPNSDSLLDAVTHATRTANRATAAQSMAMVRFVAARRSDAIAAGETPAGVHEVEQLAIEELAVELQASSNWIQQRVHVAATLAADLPHTSTAHQNGRLDEAKTRAICATAWRLHQPD